MCPAATSTTSPSGNFRPSLMMVFKSEPSGFAENTRPPPTSRKNSRPEVVDFSAPVLFGLRVIVLITSSPLCGFNVVSEFQGSETHARAMTEQPCQNLVLLFSKLLDRTFPRHSCHFIRDGLLQCRCNIRAAK